MTSPSSLIAVTLAQVLVPMKLTQPDLLVSPNSTTMCLQISIVIYGNKKEVEVPRSHQDLRNLAFSLMFYWLHVEPRRVPMRMVDVVISRRIFWLHSEPSGQKR